MFTLLKRLFDTLVKIQAGIGHFFTSLPFWKEVEKLAMIVAGPVRKIAAFALRRFPFLRRFEKYLETEALTRRSPVLLAISILFIVYRGLMKSENGHIGTDVAVYPFLTIVSTFNPFLGALCGICFGAADLIQKLLRPDIFGANHFGDANYYGAMAGYVVAYSVTIWMGLFPGLLSRIGRSVAIGIFQKIRGSRAAAHADGATPPPEDSLADAVGLLGSIVGGIAGGYTGVRFVAPALEKPAFYWRPEPDVSCYTSEVETLIETAPTSAIAGAVGGAIAATNPQPPKAPPFPGDAPSKGGGAPPKLPNQPQDPGGGVPGEGRPPMTYTDAAGRKHEYEYDPETGDYVNILTGGVFVDSQYQELKRNDAGNEEFRRIQREKVKNKDTAMDRALDEIKESYEQKRAETHDAYIEKKKALIQLLMAHKIRDKMRQDENEATEALFEAKVYDYLLWGAETVEVAADFGIDVCEGLLTAGGTIQNPMATGIKYGYHGVKGAASGWSETFHEGGPNTTGWDYVTNMGAKSVGNLATTKLGDVIQGAKLGGYNPFATVIDGKSLFKPPGGYRVVVIWTKKGVAAVNAVKSKGLGDVILNPIKDYLVPGKKGK